MNKTVIDLEFTPIPSKFKEIRKICRHEIIEIGAVKLDENDEIVDKFDVFDCKPDSQNHHGRVKLNLYVMDE